MAFDEVSFPFRVGYGAKGGTQFSTEIVTIAGGYERRNQNWSAARRRYNAALGVQSVADMAALNAFFCARCGRARGFRLKDWTDFSSAADGVSTPLATDQRLGTGDGSLSLFQLQKSYSDSAVAYRRVIKKPVAGSVLIACDGVLLPEGWSVDCTSGLVSFAAAPAPGCVVTAGFLFDVPVRFDTDILQISLLQAKAEKVDVPLVEVRIA